MGIHYNDRCSLQITNVTITDATNGVASFIVGPAIGSHELEKKVASFSNMVLVGTTPWYDCNVEDIYLDDRNWIPTGKNRKQSFRDDIRSVFLNLESLNT